MRFSILASSIALASISSTTYAWTSRGVSRILNPATFARGVGTSRRIGRRSPRSGFFSAVHEEVSSSTACGASDELDSDYKAAYEGAVAKLTRVFPEDKLPLLDPLKHFIKEYLKASQVAVSKGVEDKAHNAQVCAGRILNAINLALQYGMKDSPLYYTFDVSHTAMRGIPDEESGNEIDFYEFGCDFFKPCMDAANRKLLGVENLEKAKGQLAKGENVVFLANHQSEADPQVVSVCFEDMGFEQMAADLTYVAGHKVTTDPLAIPFSMGRNLICIHSKKHVDADPETKGMKQKQNLMAMSAMLDKMKAGGCGLWVAPSGGRDRRNVETKEVPIAPFDSKTIDMFRLMGNKSKKLTHYYPMSIVSYDLCPPPDYVVAGVGEERNIRFVPVGVSIGEEIKSEGGLEGRKEFCRNAQAACDENYQALLKELGML